MKLYLDNCCYNRLFDDLSIERNRVESEAVLSIIKLAQQGFITIIGSDIVEMEIDANSNIDKKDKVSKVYKSIISNKIDYDDTILQRAKEIQTQNKYIRRKDSLHLASAEKEKVDVLLTTDDNLEKYAKDILQENIKALNPLEYMMEDKNGC
jgi:predicted nucleic acid-binding protein